MEPQIQRAQPFQFNPRQLRIFERLMRVGQGPASFYRDACALMEKDMGLESNTHLVAHLLREIESSLRSVMRPFDYKPPEKCEKCGNRPEGHKAEIKAIIAVYELEKSGDVVKLWLELANQQAQVGLAKRAHRNALGSPRKVDQDFNDLWQNMELLLNVLLDKMEANYLKFISVLDGLLAKTSVGKGDVQSLQQHVPNNNVTLGYFFEKLEHTAWLKPLAEKGFFNNPPEPITNNEDRGISYPYWPQANYLKKMAKIEELQGDVLIVCLHLETDNVRAQADLLDIALILPVDMTIQILNKQKAIDEWFTPEKYGKLISYLSQQGKKDEALELSSKLLTIQPSPKEPKDYAGYKIPNDPIALIRDWDYEQILENDYPPLVDIAGISAIKVLLDQLENYIKFSNKDQGKEQEEDYSEIWRSAIEENSDSHRNGVRDLLIDGIRNSGERFLKRNPIEINNLVMELEKRKLLIFKRLALHFLRLFPEDAKEKIVQVLINKEEFKDKQRLTHEYFLLAEAQATLLNETQRKQIWSWIEKGPDIKVDEKSNPKPTEEQVQKYIKNWQMYHLMPFKDLDIKGQEYFKGLVSDVGEPYHPSFRSWTSGGSWGPTSSLSPDQIKKMKPDDIVKHLKNWEPPSSDPLDTSREGTSRELTTEITNNPERFTEIIPSFKDLDASYVRAVFTGHRDALRQSKKFNWEPILDLCDIVLAKPIEIIDRKASVPFGDDPDWSWCRNAIAELIEEGLLKNEGQLPVSLRERIWTIVEILTGDPDPTPEKEEKFLKSHPDPLSSAINSIRGDAIAAAIQYGLWLKNSIPENKQSEWSLTADAPELLKVLQDHLNPIKDPSLGIRALYGEKLGNLFWLDKEWVQDNQGIIFPEDTVLQKYFNAAWDTYMTFIPAYNEVFKALITQYQRGVKEIGSHRDGKHHLESPEQNLAQHLIQFYWKGLITLDDKLLQDFYQAAPVELKADVIEFMGRVGKNDKEIPKDIKVRFIALVEQRIKDIKKNKGDIQEFEGFSWWVDSKKFDVKWILDKLLEVLELGCDLKGDHLVIEEFVNMVPLFPLEIIKCTRLMVENDKKGWGVLHWGEELKTVVKTALEGNNKEAITEATEFVHRLAARGQIEFKELLPLKSSI